MSKTTIKDIAKAMNVSAATISNALNNKAGVAEEKRKLIVEMARKMGYQPNVFAKNLVNQKSHTIGLIVSSISDPFYPELARGAQEKAIEMGYCLMLFNTDHDKSVERRSIETLGSRGADGVILSTILQNDPNIPFLQELKLPFVLVNRHLLEPRNMGSFDSVVLDNYEGGYLSAQHLLQMGHSKIVIIAGALDASTAILRTRGALDAMKACGISESEIQVIDCGYVTETAYEEAKALLKIADGEPPTAFLCQGDNMALGVREAVFEAGLTVPNDIAVIGFDDIDFSSVSGVELTTVSHRQYEMGMKGAELLIKKLSDKSTLGQHQNIVLKPELIIRKSCGFHLKG